MIYPYFKQCLLEGRCSLSGVVGITMIDGDHYQYSDQHQSVADLPGQALLGEPQALVITGLTNGVVTAQPLSFPAIRGMVPDSLLIFLGTGELVCLIDQLDWSERAIDGRRLEINWTSQGVFVL